MNRSVEGTEAVITKKDVAQYFDMPVRVTLADGRSFEGIYWGWQLDVSGDVPNAMPFYPLDGRGLHGGKVTIEAERVSSVEPMFAERTSHG